MRRKLPHRIVSFAMQYLHRPSAKSTIRVLCRNCCPLLNLKARYIPFRFVSLCKLVRDQKDPKIIGVQATSTIKQLSLLDFQVHCHSCAESAGEVCIYHFHLRLET